MHNEYEAIYTDDEIEEIKSQVMEIMENLYLEEVFGLRVKVDREDWTKKILK